MKASFIFDLEWPWRRGPACSGRLGRKASNGNGDLQAVLKVIQFNRSRCRLSLTLNVL